MNQAPEYFKLVREKASKRWDQLEQDPELAGPWHQLFKQVQSPRHIVSELLQNADDAEATFASVQIENGVFTFIHNGEDFVEEHFASLCRFGYSNKRALHTIGFRGIGFKSTFSLGDRVELYTPSLSIAFDSRRFTEPIWIDAPLRTDGLTEVRVRIKDKNRQREVEKNLQEWLNSPVSLLFFKNIRHMNIQGTEVKWNVIGPGPVTNTEWVELLNDDGKRYLRATSSFEAFPDDALDEIKQERMIGIDEDTDFPPCQVEIVLGANGRLFVVLPTGVETSLPFACNAPFIQDPARMKIKDPEISPTNRWLMERVGKLAASVMLEWLRDSSLGIDDRAEAYSLLPRNDEDEDSLETVCSSIVNESFKSTIIDEDFLLTYNGELTPANQSVIIPSLILNVWPPIQALSLLVDNPKISVLSNSVSLINKQKLMKLDVIEEVSKSQILENINNKHLPKPQNWFNLLKLWVYIEWAYIAPEIVGYSRYSYNKKNLHIIPVQNSDVLYSANEVVRLGKKKILESDNDWQFLSKYLLFSDQQWFDFLNNEKRHATEIADKKLLEKIRAANVVLQKIELDESTDISEIIGKISIEFFKKRELNITDCVQLAQISAKMKADVSHYFLYVTKNGRICPISDIIVYDKDGTLERILPGEWTSRHLLHPSYLKEFTSCNRAEWVEWTSSNRSGINTFVPIMKTDVRLWGKDAIQNEMNNRGCKEELSFPYVTREFRVEDWDFDELLWNYWTLLAEKEDNLWGHLFEHVLAQPRSFWLKAKDTYAVQISTTKSRKKIIRNPLLPAWILKLRELPCIPDTKGFYRKPGEIFRRTTETEALLDIEPFIDFKYDNEANRDLLVMLGVCDKPLGPDRMLDRLHALSKSSNPPVNEVDKWYLRLDQMLNNCSTDDFLKVKKAFSNEKLILTEANNWVNTASVFLSSDELDLPGAEIIRPYVKDLTIWRKIGVADRPTADLLIQWLQELPVNKSLSKEDARRVRMLLPLHAMRIWDECGKWLNLAGELISIDDISYTLTMQSLIPWGHLYGWVKEKTADFRNLPRDITVNPPFSVFPTLASQIDNRFYEDPSFISHPKKKPWLNQLGYDLCRIILDDEDNSNKIILFAEDLSETTWQVTPGLETIPYIEGIPAGTPRRVEVMWLDRVLYVDDLPNAKLARHVPDVLSKFFNNQDITAALSYCYGRSPQDVTEYLKENFELSPQEEIKAPVQDEKKIENKTQYEDKNEGYLQVNAGGEQHIIDAPVSSNEETDDISSDDDVIQNINVEDDILAELETTIEEGTSDNGEAEVEVVKKRPTKPSKPSMMEQFALSQGYKKEDKDTFFHPNGNRISKVNHGSIFPWEKLSASGDLVCRFWPKDHCLEHEPLQLEAELWGMIDKYPDTCSLILTNPERKPIQLSGDDLCSMRENGKITLHPATYRIVYENDN
jgi:hypothetical protein